MIPEKQSKIYFEAKIKLDACRIEKSTHLHGWELLTRTKLSGIEPRNNCFGKVLLFALKKAKFYRIISVPDCNSKRSKTRLICEEKEKYASSKKAGKNIYETVNTFTSQKVTFKINDWRNDQVLVLLSMAVRLRQVFVVLPFSSNSAHWTGNFRRPNCR